MTMRYSLPAWLSGLSKRLPDYGSILTTDEMARLACLLSRLHSVSARETLAQGRMPHWSITCRNMTHNERTETIKLPLQVSRTLQKAIPDSIHKEKPFKPSIP